MTNVLIAYTSQFGNTKRMAETMAESVRELEEAACVLRDTEAVSEADFVSADAIILGTPVKMGAVDWRMKKTIDTTLGRLWRGDQLVGKVGACFASGGGYGRGGAGVEIALISLANALLELGLVYVPLPKNIEGYGTGGLHWGPYGVSADANMQPKPLSDDQLGVCATHVRNVVRVAAALREVTFATCR